MAGHLLKDYLLVGFGGMAGSIARYATSAYFLAAYPAARFPWGTFAVNLTGCFLIGVVAGAVERVGAYNAELRLAIITGFLGGFTTFSAFGIETVHLVKNGIPVMAGTYAVSSVVLGAAAAYLGLKLAV